MRPHVGLHVGFLREAAAAQVATVAELDLVGLVGPLVQLQNQPDKIPKFQRGSRTNNTCSLARGGPEVYILV